MFFFLFIIFLFEILISYDRDGTYSWDCSLKINGICKMEKEMLELYFEDCELKEEGKKIVENTFQKGDLYSEILLIKGEYPSFINLFCKRNYLFHFLHF